jgi:hypothetical protein
MRKEPPHEKAGGMEEPAGPYLGGVRTSGFENQA